MFVASWFVSMGLHFYDNMYLHLVFIILNDSCIRYMLSLEDVKQ